MLQTVFGTQKACVSSDCGDEPQPFPHGTDQWRGESGDVLEDREKKGAINLCVDILAWDWCSCYKLLGFFP